MTRHARCPAIVALVGFVALATPAAGQNAGRFEAQASLGGASAASISGFAISEGNADKGGWSAHLVTPGGGSSILLLFAGDGRPPVGEYDVVDLVAHDFEPPAGSFAATGGVDPQLFAVAGFHSTSGTISITASSPASVEGAFDFRASGAADGAAVSVEGTFATANRGD